jgi:hypothetical protein
MDALVPVGQTFIPPNIETFATTQERSIAKRVIKKIEKHQTFDITFGEIVRNRYAKS